MFLSLRTRFLFVSFVLGGVFAASSFVGIQWFRMEALSRQAGAVVELVAVLAGESKTSAEFGTKLKTLAHNFKGLVWKVIDERDDSEIFSSFDGAATGKQTVARRFETSWDTPLSVIVTVPQLDLSLLSLFTDPVLLGVTAGPLLLLPLTILGMLSLNVLLPLRAFRIALAQFISGGRDVVISSSVGTNDELGKLESSLIELFRVVRIDRVSNGHADSLLNLVNIGSMIVTPRGEIRAVNTALSHAFGRFGHELVGTPLAKFIKAEDIEVILNPKLQSLQLDEFPNDDKSNFNLSGNKITFEQSALLTKIQVTPDKQQNVALWSEAIAGEIDLKISILFLNDIKDSPRGHSTYRAQRSSVPALSSLHSVAQ